MCDICNSEVFTRLETIFTEDTCEGVFGQRLNLDGRGSVTIRNNQFKITRLNGFGDEFFNEMFLFLEPKENRIVPALKNQIKLRRLKGGFRVFRPEALRSVPKGGREFKKLSADMQKLDQKDIAIFGETQEEVKSMISLLHEYGVNYKEKASKGHQFEPGDKITIEEEYSCSVDRDLARVFAKIAFNYFAYCAIQDGKRDILFSQHFDKIRNFIHSGEGVMKEIIVSITQDPVLKLERDEGRRVIMHFINFVLEDGQIVATMTFFGGQAIYKIVLGAMPEELNLPNFGGGHAFNPFERIITNLSQTPEHLLTPAQKILKFGLYRRN